MYTCIYRTLYAHILESLGVGGGFRSVPSLLQNFWEVPRSQPRDKHRKTGRSQSGESGEPHKFKKVLTGSQHWGGSVQFGWDACQ